FAIDREFLSADPHVRVPAGHIVVSRGFDLFRAGNAGAIAIRDDYLVGAHRRLDAAEQEIIPPAAPNENERSGAERESPDSHGPNRKLLCYAKSIQIDPCMKPA